MKKTISILTLLLGCLLAFAQNEEEQTYYTFETFGDTRVVNGQSIETNGNGELKFVIQHRFGRVNGSFYELFGLDQSTIRFGLSYGLNDWITLGFGRSSFEKTYDGYAKVKLLKQSSGKKNMPFTATFFTSMAIQTLKWTEPERQNYFTSRLYYSFQLMIARKLSDRFSIQIAPTLVHRNLVATADEAHDVIAIGGALNYKVSKTIDLNLEYYHVLPNQLVGEYYNSLSLGVDIKTNRHVFQLHLSNSQGMLERFYIPQTTGDWFKGDIHLGFNISRDWQMKGKDY